MSFLTDNICEECGVGVPIEDVAEFREEAGAVEAVPRICNACNDMLELEFKGMELTICFDDYDTGEECEIPAKWGICPVCEGHGKHMNETIANHAYSAEEFFEEFPEEEDRDMYFNGGYDVSCENCGGSGKVLVPRWEKMDFETTKKYERYLDTERYYMTEREAELKYGY